MKKSKRVTEGLIFLLGAAALILGGLGYLQGVGFWTVVFAVVLAAVLVKGILHRSWGEILFALAFLLILFKGPLGFPQLSGWLILGAALLGTIGLNLLFPRRHKHWHGGPFAGGSPVCSDDTIAQEDGDVIRCEVNFNSASKYVASQEIKSVFLNVSFGGLDFYLDNAALKQNTAVIQAEVSFGSLDIYLPKTWNVVVQAQTAFGSLDENGSCDLNGEYTVYIRGEVSFGSMDLYYV